MEEAVFVERIERLGGRAYIAGGWVRDQFRGVDASDKDYVITGVEEMEFCGEFPDAPKVGNSFPVYLLPIDGKNAEVAFARMDRKVGRGYKGFAVQCDPSVSIENDLYRRDTTMNSIAYCLRSREFIDPYHGIDDIRRKRIRATSAHFREDPVRALRAARQAAQTGFTIEQDTIHLMEECREEIEEEPQERLAAELSKALKVSRPSLFFDSLKQACLLQVAYPQIFALIGKTQSAEHHPEGDAFAHSMIALDLVAQVTERVEVRFSALVHDLGKGLTPQEQLPHHYGHELRGMEALMLMNHRMTLPKLWLVCAELVITEHMRAMTLRNPGKIVDLLLRIEKNPLGFDGFNTVIVADSGILPDYLSRFPLYLEAIHRVRGGDAPKSLTGKEIGRWVRDMRIRALKELMA